MELPIELLIFLGLAVGGSGSAAWVGVKVGLNGVKRDTEIIRRELQRACDLILEHRERIATLEERCA